MKLDLDRLAHQAAALGGLTRGQVGGLAMLFAMVEMEAFRDGYRAAGGMVNPDGPYRTYALSPTAPPPDIR